MEYYNTCRCCGGNDFVTKYSKGTVVCRGCGVVSEMNILDDRDYGYSDYNEYLENYNYDHDITYICDCLHLPEYMKLLCESKYKDIEKSFKGANVILCKCVVVYMICLENKIPRAPHDFQQMFGVPQSKFNLMLKELLGAGGDVSETLPPVTSSIRSRLNVLACTLINDNLERNKVLNKCESIESKLTNNNEYMNKRTHKIDPILLYYVCQDIGIEISRAKVMEEAQISSSTFVKHLKMIKAIVE
jgi:transcription initiation factor TFIIIB Brf1 subunit/transcription initiation factor TFIIB